MLHQIIKEARKSAGITQQQLSKLTGISRDRIGDIEAGNSKLSLPELEQYIAAIDAFIIVLPAKYKP